ncbi:MAG: ABC transporter permease [Oscillospiraceae bacterium]|nr:ABC transporter permease [Oscillospiraceae bacterium]
MQTVWALCVRNLRDFVRNKARLIFSLIFPFFFIYVFGSIFENFAANMPIDIAPIAYMLAGIAIATVFDVTLRISSSTIDDMSSGFMKEVLVSPVSRLSIAGGQFLSGAVIGTINGLFILLGGVLLGFRITSPMTVLFITLVMIFVGFVFSGFGLFIATNTKNTQTFQVVSMVLTMPMTFLSGAYIPVMSLPPALQMIARFNPLTYAVMLFRAISLEVMDLPAEVLVEADIAIRIGNFIVTPWISALALLGFGVLFLLLSTLTFSKTDFSKMSRSAGDAVDWG